MKSSDIVIMTTAEAKPGKEKIVQQALCDVAQAAREESGCIEYCILHPKENSTVTINFERWTSKEARDTFLASKDVKEFASAVSGAFVGPPQPKSYEMLDEA